MIGDSVIVFIYVFGVWLSYAWCLW